MAIPASPPGSPGASGTELVDLDEIRAAAARLAPYIAPTPIVRFGRDGPLLKAESLHPAGSFKIRGAFNSLLQLPAEIRSRGVIAHSSGNHAIAVAMAGDRLGIAITIVMPRDAPRVKQTRTQAFGAEVVLVGPGSDERVQVANELATRRDTVIIEPYDSRAIIAATGTITLEALEAHPEIAEIHVPISGGGLAAGVATAAKLLDPDIRVIGVEPEVAADALASRRAGRIVSLPAEQMAQTMADGLRVQQVGALPWLHLERHVDEIVTVSEAEILEAMRLIALEARLVAEPSGAVPVASVRIDRAGSIVPSSRRAAVLCGGNVDPELLAAALTSTTS